MNLPLSQAIDRLCRWETQASNIRGSLFTNSQELQITFLARICIERDAITLTSDTGFKFHLTLSDAMTFRYSKAILQINSDYIRQMRSRLSGSISAEQITSLRFYGASTEFVDKLKQMGYANLNARQLISMRFNGVSIAFIQDLQAQGRRGLSADELIGIRARGSN